MTPPFLDPAPLRARAGAGYERGVAYFRARAVRSVRWHAAEGALDGVVTGNRSAPYRVRVHADAHGGVGATSCTCPMAIDCKHVVAAVLEANAGRDRAPTATHAAVAEPADQTPGRAGSSPTGWRSLIGDDTADDGAELALGIELRQRAPFRASQWTPRRVEAVTARALAARSDDLVLVARPFVRGARGAWIKGRTSWDAVRRDAGSASAARARWFAELYSIARDTRLVGPYSDVTEWLPLDGVQSSLLWPQLADAAARGIAIVAAHRGQRVTLAGAASAQVRVEEEAGGALTLRAHVSIDGEEARGVVAPIGRHGVYAVALHRDPVPIVLAPLALSAPVHALLRQGGRTAVPRDEREEFLRRAVPRLTRSTTLVATGGLELPEPAPPLLVLTLRFASGHRVSFDLAWQYAGMPALPYPAADDLDRDTALEHELRDRVESAWAQAWSAPFTPAGDYADAEAAEFAVRVAPAIERVEGVRVRTEGRRPDYRELTGRPEITVTTVESADADWFDLGVVVTVDGRSIPFGALFAALSRGKRRMLLADGAYFSLSHPALDRLRELIDEAGGLTEWETGPRLSRYQTALWADFEDVADRSQTALSWRAQAESLRDAGGVEPTPVPPGLRAELRPYQREGFDWLALLWRHRLGGILADDMGLGKTVQTLALVASALHGGETRPFLVVAPTSVVPTWRAEAARFVPDARVRVVDATRARRGEPISRLARDAQIVVTSYALLRLDEEFAEADWAAVVLDEGQFVKNAATKLHRAVLELRADAVYVLTGTPLENGLGELHALLSLAAPGLFPSARRFRDEYVQPIEKGRVPDHAGGEEYRAARLERLRRRIRPLVLRRTKESVAPDLPERQEQHVQVELSPAHRALYDATLQRERQKVLGLLDDLDRNRFIVFRSLTLLRMLSLAPGLVDPAHDELGSARLDVLLDQLVELAAEGHRALVFSQFTSFLARAAARLDEAGIEHAWLDGSTRRRAEVIEGFRAGSAPAFLISLKAGGFGLTLTEADYVFVLDPWWNPAAEAQAVDRTHRIGQTRTVFVYRYIAAGTIEEKVVALQQRKARLFSAVLDDGDFFAQSLTADDIRGLLEP